MMGKYDGWYTAEQIQENGICTISTANNYCSEGLIANDYKTKNDGGHWLISPDIYDVLKKAKDKKIPLKYALDHIDEIKALPDDCCSIEDAANEIDYTPNALFTYLSEYDVPGTIRVSNHTLFTRLLVDKCKGPKKHRSLRYLFSQLDRNNSDPEAIKFRKQFEAELEASDKASKPEITEPISKSESIEESEFIQPDNSDTFYRQGHKFRIEMLDTSEIINQTNHNIKILQAISKDLNMPMLSTFCDQILDKLNSIHLQSKVINNYSYMLEYVDDDPNPILLPRLPRRSEGAVA